MRPSNMRGALSVFGGNRTPANFRPAVAKVVVDALCTDGGVVWDPCAGFGGRLAGTLCSNRNATYIGTEPSPETVKALRKMGSQITTLLGFDESRFSILEGVAEKDCPTPASVNLVFTSPPYYQTEQYRGGPQSYLTYDTYDKWRDGFLKSFVTNAFLSLVEGGYFAVNIQNVRIKGMLYPLVRDLDTLAVSVGFKRYQRWWLPLHRMGPQQRPDEPILVYVKSEDAVSVDWNVDGEHTTYLKDQSTKTRFATCVDCGIALKGPVREGRRCKEHKLKNDADVHREARTNHRKVVPAKTTRMWTCRICNTSREVPLGGAHPVCPDCKDTLTTKRRTHLCEYRHCGREFYDDSMQGNAVYCHVEHRRREKLFRSGLATDLSYFKKADPVLTSE